nr:PAS domain S-box protein [uncultured Methanoregula sp.]
MISILYVDDEPTLLDLCRSYLEMSGDFMIDIAGSAPDAMEKISTTHYDAIVSDYQMPEMDGITFLKEVRSRLGDIPFILFTGKGREEIVIEAINNGADFYLQKGGDARSQFAELAHKIKKAVERRKAKEELRTNETLLSSFKVSVDWASDQVYWLDFKGRFLYVNDSACRNTGYSREELLSMTVFDLDPDFTPEMLSQSRTILREKKTRVFTTRHRHKDGTIVDVEIMTNYVIKDGRDYSFAFARDITRRKRTEEALQESEERYRRLIAQSFDAVVIHQNGSVVSANDAAARLVKATSPGDMIGRPTLDFVDTAFFGVVSERIKTMSKAPGVTVPLIEERFRCLDGTTVDVEVIATAAVFRGKPAVQVVARDISGRKQSEEALRVANRQLNLLNSITRHDILNKIMAISGYLELMQQEPLDPKVMKMVGILEANTRSIGEYIEFTRMYQDIGSTGSRWQDLARILPSRSHLPLDITLDADIEGVSVYADPLFEKIFLNLLDNTLRHGNHATLIRVYAREYPDGLKIFWEDNGIGIPFTEKEKIFRQGHGKNTGLGLFLTREILSITGITISENGEPGLGGRFEMNVPAGGFRVTPGRTVDRRE